MTWVMTLLMSTLCAAEPEELVGWPAFSFSVLLSMPMLPGLRSCRKGRNYMPTKWAQRSTRWGCCVASSAALMLRQERCPYLPEKLMPEAQHVRLFLFINHHHQMPLLVL